MGNSNSYWLSTDAVTWTAVTTAVHAIGLGTGGTQGLAFGNGRFVAVGGLGFLASTNLAPGTLYITTQPVNATPGAGGMSTLSVVAANASVATYQWYRGTSGDTSIPISGATSASYSTSLSANYWVRVTSGGATVDSATAAVIAAPVITSPLAANGTYGQPFEYIITASNNPTSFYADNLPAGLAVSQTTGVISGTPTVAGTFERTISATNSAGAGTATLALNIAQTTQTIAFAPLANKMYGDAPFALGATATSGLTVSFSVQSGLATIDASNTVTLTGAGDVTIRATQVGNAFYAPASPVDRSFTVAKATQSITFAAIADKTLGDAPLALSAVATSGLPVGYTIVSGPATVDAAIVTLTGTGLVTVRAAQPGNASYEPAISVERSFTVAAAPTLPGQTPVGSNVIVSVQPVDSEGNPVANAPVVVVTYTGVTAPGVTTVVMMANGPTSPSGFVLGQPPVYFDIHTTATYTGSVDIAVSYAPLTFTGAAIDLILAHYSNSSWSNITTVNDTANQIIHGATNSFSIFAVFEPGGPATVTPTTIEVGDNQVLRPLLVKAPGPWSAVNTVPWVSLSTSAAFGDRNVELTIQPNTTGSDRSDSITIGGATFTLTQRPAGSGLRELWALGSDSYGQLGDSTIVFRTVPVRVLNGVQAVATGSEHSVMIKTDGSLWAVGKNLFGTLGDGTSTNRTLPVQIASGVTSVAAGSSHTLYITSNGDLWAVGANHSGQLGDGTAGSIRTTPVKIATGVLGVVAGSTHSAFLKNDSSLWAMGSNSAGQLGDGTTTQRNAPVLVAQNVASIAAGSQQTFYITVNGALWATGDNSNGQLGDNSTANKSTPVQIASDVASVTAGDSHTLFVKTNGTLWAVGRNVFGQLGDGTTTQRLVPVEVASAVSRVVAGQEHSLFLKLDGSLWSMGSNDAGQLGDGTTTRRTAPVKISTGVRSVTAAQTHSLFIKEDNSVWAMGACANGKLFDGTKSLRTIPVQVGAGMAGVAAGNVHSLFVRTDGTLLATGNNGSGRLGDGTTQNRTTPVTAAGSVIQAAAGFSHSVFVKSDGSLWGMGSNGNGQLGDGSTTSPSTPVLIANGVGSVSAGDTHTVFLKLDRTLWAMGANSVGQLGDGTTTQRTTPLQVADDVVAVAAGGAHTLFIRSDGRLWASGLNANGQLGDGSTTNRLTPVPIATGVRSVAAGSSHSLFVSTDGSVWAMGSNSAGQLGDGTGTQRILPVKVITENARAVAAGQTHSLVLKTDGSVWGTGSNLQGQLADGPSSSTTYRQFATGVAVMAAGGNSTFYITGPRSPHITSVLAVNTRVGDAFNYAIVATDAPTSFSALNLPGGLSINQTTGLISGTPNVVGSFPVTISATNAAGAGSATLVLTVDKSAQSIAFAPLVNKSFGDASFIISATVSSGLPVSFAVISGPATIDLSDTVTLTGAGDVTIRATQTGNNVYAAATPVVQTFTVEKGLQSIAFEVIIDKKVSDAPFALSATATSGLPVGFSIVAGPATVAGNILTLTGSGVVVVGASQAGGANYQPVSVERSFTVAPMGTVPSYTPVGSSVITTPPVTDMNGNPVANAPIVVVTFSQVTSGGETTVVMRSSGPPAPDGYRLVQPPIYFDIQTTATFTGSLHMAIDYSGFTYAGGGNGLILSQYGNGAWANITRVNDTANRIIHGDTGLLGVFAMFEPLDTPATTVTPSSTDVGDAAAMLPVYVASNGAWVATSTVPWARVSVPDGFGPRHLDILFERNATGTDRTGSIFFGGAIFTITQRRSGAALSELLAMGYDYHGQLGVGNENLEGIPVLSAGHVRSAAAGSSHTMFVKTDGTLWAMGYNGNGQLGDGTTTQRTAPVQIRASDGIMVTGVAAAAAGNSHTVLVKTDGTLWTMGYNGNGQLGDGTTTQRSTPMQVRDAGGIAVTGVAAAAAGSSHTVFVKTDGALWAMGYNGSGQLGDGTTTQRSTPVQVRDASGITVTGVATAAAGSSHTVFVKTDGTLWTMGNNGIGQLGDGTTTHRSTPVQVREAG